MSAPPFHLEAEAVPYLRDQEFRRHPQRNSAGFRGFVQWVCRTWKFLSFSLVNPLFLWPFSRAMLHYQRVNCCHKIMPDWGYASRQVRPLTSTTEGSTPGAMLSPKKIPKLEKKNAKRTHRFNWVWVKIRYPNNWMVNTKLD